MGSMRQRLWIVVVLLAFVGVGIFGYSLGSARNTAEPLNTDVAFAQAMIPHHEQALDMADMALAQRDLDPELRELIQGMKDAQGPEIEQMRGWLEEWGAEELPASGHGMGRHNMNGFMMGGMMSNDQMRDLMGSRGMDFERMWMLMMIEHHEGAIEMSEQVLRTTEDPQVRALAEDIIESQTEEIAIMRRMLVSS
jgi:uncharacterized protein (DUF305 family)